MKRFLWIVVFLPFFASCGLGIPASISASGTPGIYLPMGEVFSAAGQKELLNEYFDIDTILKQVESAGAKAGGTPLSEDEPPRLWNYVYSQIDVGGGKKINSVPQSPDAIQTYLLLYPVASIDIASLLPGFIQGGAPRDVTIPSINFFAPSFGTMLSSLKGILFKYVHCYILVDGITNTPTSPAHIELGTENNNSEYGAGDLTPSSFDFPIEGDFTKKINSDNSTRTSMADGIPLAKLFDSGSAQSPMRINIIDAKVSSAATISIKMLFVLPLWFKVPPELDKDGNPVYVIPDGTTGEKWVKLDVEKLAGLSGTDISTLSSSVRYATFHIYDVKNTLFSGVSLAFERQNSSIWDKIDLDNGAGGDISMSGVSVIPRMALITKAEADGNGSIALPPVQRDDEGNIITSFDFSIVIEAQTDFEQTVNLPR